MDFQTLFFVVIPIIFIVLLPIVIAAMHFYSSNLKQMKNKLKIDKEKITVSNTKLF